MGTGTMENSSTESEQRPEKYIEEYLYKKECDKKWIKYWVTLQGTCMMFYSHHYEETEKRDAFRGFIELTKATKCHISKRKKYSYPFFLNTGRSKYYFKCPSPLQRHQWIYAIESSIQGKESTLLPLTLPPPRCNSALDDDEEVDDNASADGSLDNALESDDIKNTDAIVHNNNLGDDYLKDSKVILVAAQPSQHRITNFLSTEHPETDYHSSSRSPPTKEHVPKRDEHRVLKTSTPENVPRNKHMIPVRGSVNQGSENLIRVPDDEVSIHPARRPSLNSRNDDYNDISKHEDAASRMRNVKQAPSYAQCGPFILTTSATGVTRVDVNKRAPMPKQSVSGPTIANVATQLRSRMVRSADSQRGRTSLPAMNNRPHSQGSGSKSLDGKGVHLSARSKYSRHLISPEPELS